jgi:hypothetical protein
MKTRLTITILLVILTIAFVFRENTKQTNPPQPNNLDSFIVGAFNSGLDVTRWNVSNTLGFNLWHVYNENKQSGGKNYPDGWWRIGAPGDSLFAPIGYYAADVKSILDDAGEHEMKALMMRPKVEYLCYGQRSDYQCETVTGGDLWFYSFNDHHPTAEQITDSGQGVIHCRFGIDNPDTVVKRLKANAEQCHRSNAYDSYRYDSQCDWLIKPRIRIDSNFAHNNPTTPVCSITVKNQGGNTIKNVILNGRNFLDEFNNYDGRYIEEYRIFSGDDTLIVHGDWGNGWAFSARGSGPDGSNHADIQVYWYGYCDMWLDYVRVDNDIADMLLNPNNQFYSRSQDWLQWEAHDIACQSGSSFKYYIELFEFNNIPCMSYVSRKLDSITSICGKHVSLWCIPIPFTYSGHVPWSERLTVQNVNHFKTNFIEKMGVTEFMMGIYPFNSSWIHPEVYPNYNTWTRIPNTLPGTYGTINRREISPFSPFISIIFIL